MIPKRDEAIAAATNPYASPQSTYPKSAPAVPGSVPALQLPSIALFALSILWGSVIGIWEFVFVLNGAMRIARGMSVEYWIRSQAGDLIQSTVIIPTFLIAYGAWCMRKRVRYRVALSSAIVACLPCLSPFVIFGIPFGLWALLVLWRRDVRAAFATNHTNQTSAASNPT